ncbi:UvrD-helicase domain-containing protein [Labrys portucalensis]|uniref:DNA 3'-5' helicase n=1 Tax=Labrys neptuniae TaxID=376174 RepID=A0ABV6ZRE6_9HYPH
MDQAGLSLEPEVKAVLDHLANGTDFLLSGGAGSGKTYSLVQVIGELLRTDRSSAIACITYTNAAVHEIESRISSDRLSVSTIHDFLWAVIGSFQTELRLTLTGLMEGEDPKINPGSVAIAAEMFAGKAIQYKEYTVLGEGIVSHDEVIVLARAMFDKYPKLGDVVRDRFRYILVDEYQDTAHAVVEILLDILPKSGRRGNCGFFGDAMQAIYEDGIGDLRPYVAKGAVLEVQKEQNRRNPRLVYELANNLRTDGLRQRASADISAPNMKGGEVREGQIRFYYSTGDEDRLQEIRDHLAWDFADVVETKELNLTHNLIAPQAGFGDLMAIYDKDGVIGFRDRIVKYIKDTDDIAKYDDLTFGEVVAALQAGKGVKELNKVSPTAGMKDFIRQHPELLADAYGRNFRAFRRMYVDKDQLIDDKKQSEADLARKGSKRCDFIKHVFQIQQVVHLYEERRYNEFLRLTQFRINRAADKVRLKEHVEAIAGMSERPVIEVIEYAHQNGLCRIDDRLGEFRERKGYLYDRLVVVPYLSYQKLYAYLEGRTTYSTQHKIKGREFDRVFVVLDSGGWNNYNFNNLFEIDGNPSVLARTQKLFYVCCTRAKETLAVYFRNPSPRALAQANSWFGAANCIKL